MAVSDLPSEVKPGAPISAKHQSQVFQYVKRHIQPVNSFQSGGLLLTRRLSGGVAVSASFGFAVIIKDLPAATWNEQYNCTFSQITEACVPVDFGEFPDKIESRKKDNGQPLKISGVNLGTSDFTMYTDKKLISFGIEIVTESGESVFCICPFDVRSILSATGDKDGKNLLVGINENASNVDSVHESGIPLIGDVQFWIDRLFGFDKAQDQSIGHDADGHSQHQNDTTCPLETP